MGNTLTLYTLGYLAGTSKRKLADLMTLGVPVVDVRESPASQRWEWTREALEAKKGLDYTWIQDLGNLNYKAAIAGQDVPILIRDLGAGLEKLQAILVKHGHACIICGCVSKKTCHRIHVAEQAKLFIPRVTVYHL